MNKTKRQSLTASILTFVMFFQIIAGVFMPVNIFKPFDKPLTADAAWYDTGGSWSYRKAITIHASQVAADLAYFPVLVNINNDADLGAHALANGYDIRFTLSDGSTPLAFEREDFVINSGQATGNFWVRIPTLSSSQNTTIYMYYGKSDATDGQNVTGTWDENGANNFKAVYHMNQDPSGTSPQMLNSVNNTKDGTTEGSMTSGQSVNGVAGKELQFDGNDAIDISSLSLGILPVTLESWIKPASGAAQAFVILGGSDTPAPQMYVYSSSLNIDLRGVGGSSSIGNIVAGNRYYAMGLYNNNSNRQLFVNGVPQTENTINNTSTVRIRYIGKFSEGAYFLGNIDEVRISNVARSAGYSATVNANISAPSTFYSLGNEVNASLWLSGYSYRKAITVTNQVASALSGYQVKLTIDTAALYSAGKMKIDGSDLRFADMNGVDIPYWIESGINTSSTIIWIKTDLASSEAKTVYLYYGNSGASAVSNGDNVFTIFDQFDGSAGGSINSSKWTVTKKGSSSAVAQLDGAGSAQLAGEPNVISSANIVSTQTFQKGSIIEYRESVDNAYYHDLSWGSTTTLKDEGGGSSGWWHTSLDNGYGAVIQDSLVDQHASNVHIRGTGARTILQESSGAVHPSLNTFYTIQITWDASGNIIWKRDSTTLNATSDNTYLDGTMYLHFHQGEYSDGNGGNRFMDWVRVRKYAATEPTSSMGAEQGLALSNWQYRKAITIQASQVAADLTNFPVLINLASDNDLRNHAQSTGNDILFTSSGTAWNAGTTSDKLSHEIESYNFSNGSLQAWVKIPNLSHTQNTVVYMYYGNANAGALSTTAVWNNNYKGVWHLDGDASGAAGSSMDSTGNGYNSTNTTMEPVHATGQIGGGLNFYGSSRYIAFSNNSALTPATMTWSFWVKPAALPAYDAVIGLIDKRDDSGGSNGYVVELYNNSGTQAIYIASKSAGGYAGGFPYTLSTNTYSHIVAVLSNGSYPVLYVNGVSQTPSSDYASGSTSDYNVPLYFGRRQDGKYYNGLMDEVRFANTGRDVSWALTEYNNQSSPSTFYTLGGEQVPATNYTFTAPSPSVGPINTPSQNFTITPDGIYTGTITITPSGVGLSDPIILTFTDSSASQTFTITPATAGTVTLASINSGTLTDPSAVTYSAVSISASPNTIIQSSTNNTITLTGISTSWTAGTPGSPTFTLTGGTGASITSQTVTDLTHATLTIDAGSTSGTLTITDPFTNATTTVVVVPSTGAIIAAFNFTVPITTGIINEINHTVTLNVPYGTNVTNLTPTIAISSGATIFPNTGASHNFANSSVYTVTAQDGIAIQDYTVTVIVSPSSGSAFVPPIKPIIPIKDNQIDIDNLPSNIIQIAISQTPDFKNASWEGFSKEKLQKLESSSDMFYLKFRTVSGGVSDVISYERKSAGANSESLMKLNDGEIVKTPSNPDIYIIKYKNNKQYKRLILSPSVFKSYQHLKWNNIKIISQNQMDAYQTSDLVQVAGDQNIYELTPLGDMGTRQLLDKTQTYDADSIYEINRTDRDTYKLAN